MGKRREEKRKRQAEAESRSADLSSLLTAIGWGQASATGVSVTTERAMRLSAVAACVRVISEDVAALPLHLYRRLEPRGKERAHTHPLYALLHDLPNPELTSYELRENLVGHLLGWGWGYCEIEFDNAGRRKALWPLRPDRVKRLAPEQPNGAGRYEITLPDQSKTILQRWQVWAIRGWSLEAWEAQSLIENGREAIGLGIAAEEYGARFFGNDSRPGGVLEHPGKLSQQAADRMRASWNAAHSGLSNAHRVAILEEGVKWQQIGISPENAQFLETRKFQRSEIAGLFRVPPHKIGDLEKATFSNIEQQSIDYVNDALLPVCTRIEQTIFRDLLSPAERRVYFAEHLLTGRLRGEMLSRYQAYAVGRQNGWLSADDIREMENMNPLPDDQGKMYLVPLNMQPAEQAGDSAASDESAAGDSAAGDEPQAGASRPPAQNDDKTRGDGDRETRRRAERRSVADGRFALGESFKPAIAAVAQRIVNREVNDLGNAKKKGRESFTKLVDPFLDGHAEVVREYVAPVMTTFCQQVVADVERELGQAAPPEVQSNLEAFSQGYITSRSEIWVEGLRQGLNKVNAGEYEDEAGWSQALDAFLTKRKTERADDWGGEEAVRVLGAIARVAYAALAVKVLRWMARGKETCPYCKDWDGRTIRLDLDEHFLQAGGSLAPDGAAVFVASVSVGHPPLHRGCDCVVIAG